MSRVAAALNAESAVPPRWWVNPSPLCRWCRFPIRREGGAGATWVRAATGGSICTKTPEDVHEPILCGRVLDGERCPEPGIWWRNKGDGYVCEAHKAGA